MYDFRIVGFLLLVSRVLALPPVPSKDALTSNDYYAWIFVVGSAGNVIKSSNAGETWACSLCGQERLVTTDLNAVHFFSSRLGFVAGQSGVIIKTVNGGANWEQSETGVTAHLHGIHIFQPLVVYAVGDAGLVLSSDNGGDTWSSAPPLQIANWNGVMYAPTLRSIRFTDSRNAILVGDCNQWFVTADGGASWTNNLLLDSPPDTANATTSMLYIAMDRFANMIAVGRNGLIYTIARQVADDSDLATFVWTRHIPPAHKDQAQSSVDITAASGFNASDFLVVGGPGGYVAISTVSQGAGLESSPIYGAEAENANLRLTAIYTPSVYTAVVATDSGQIYVSNDMTHSWHAALLPPDVLVDSRWIAMSGRNAHDEESSANCLRDLARCSAAFALLLAAVSSSLLFTLF